MQDIHNKNIILGSHFHIIFNPGLEALGGNPILKKRTLAKIIQIQ